MEARFGTDHRHRSCVAVVRVVPGVPVLARLGLSRLRHPGNHSVDRGHFVAAEDDLETLRFGVIYDGRRASKGALFL